MHGTTSATSGQFAVIISAIIRALPKGIGDLDPKQVIAAVQNGEVLEQYLHNMFLRLSGYIVIPSFNRLDRLDKPEMENWSLVEDVGFEPELNLSSLGDLESVFFLKQDEKRIDGEKLVRRARDEYNANLGLRHAVFIIEHQDQIPRSHLYGYGVFPGTIWKHTNGNRMVPCVGRNDSGILSLGFECLDNDNRFDNHYRLVRLRK